MHEMTVNQFRSHLKSAVEQVIEEHVPLRVTRRKGKAFVVISADDWEREQETLYVLQNCSLMAQIAKSLETHRQGKGYTPSPEEQAWNARDHV